jgi:hypothetical protein
MGEIYEIILKCAELRGVSNLPARSIEEFEYFVMSVLFGDELDYNDEIQETYHQFVMKADTIEEGLANAFLMYCEEIYKND